MSESNTDSAVSFLKLTSSGKVQDAFSKFAGKGFRHHNPYFDGSQAALMAGMEENARQFPGMSFSVKHTVAEDDFVAVHSLVHMQPADPGYAVVHLLRFEDGRIVELWEVGQPIPEKNPNQFGMF